tara:strand:- start:12323 stop:13570 length:1248 start_codon:yes stop_codon:yes gene_type:complete
MKKKIGSLFLLYFVVNFLFPQSISPSLLKTISFKKPNEIKSSNLLKVGLNEPFSISFDILSGFEYDLYYSLEHCDFNWEKSQLLKSEYLQGFDDVKIDNYYSSFNTYQIYTHYIVNFPNSNVRFKKSGNYVIKILDEYGVELFRRKFIVYEDLVSVNAEIKRSRDLEFISEKQVVNFELLPKNISLNNPNKNVKVCIFKNNNFKNRIENLKPQFNIGQKLIYRYDEELSFWADNEYLYFDNKYVKNTNNKISGYQLDDIYSNFLFPDISRYDKKYTYNPDINGGFLIDVANSSNPKFEADYVNIYFSLEKPKNFSLKNKIYIVGQFNNYEIDEKFKMIFNYKNNLFETKIKLKQGFYNYKYLLLDANNEIIYGGIGGNFNETENEYNIIVYYRNYGERFDRVVGVGKGLSKFITN